ncbi:MAG: hypothetical protein ACT4QF_13730 [Sporichthyaceae bacterium]
MESVERVVARLHERFADLGPSLADELIAERRAEAERDLTDS